MKRIAENRPANRVVEEPKRSPLPYFGVAIIAAALVWNYQQQSIQSPTPGPSLSERSHKAGPRQRKGYLRTVFSADDYPAEAQRNGEEGTVQAELTIDQRGRVIGCSVLRSSGHPSLDNATCSILQRRARFAPARDVNGRAVLDKVTTPPIVWRLEG